MSERDQSGRFVVGNNANPGGRPKEVAEVRALAREFGEDAIKTIAEIMRDPKAAQKTRLAAAQALLDRGYGRPATTVSDQDGNALMSLFAAAVKGAGAG